MKSLKSLLLTFGIFALIIGGLIVFSNRSGSQSPSPSGTLSAPQTLYDFGQISMAKGPVSYVFKVGNPSSEPVEIRKIYTSCMCTTASLKLSGKTFGPFGMPGHGFVPPVNQSLEASGQAEVEVVFDPAAHGPAGIGLINRTVTLETSSGSLKLDIKAGVTP